MCTTEKLKEVSEEGQTRSNLKVSSYRGGCLGYQYYEEEIAKELLKKGIQIDEVPRHELWIRARSRVKDGVVTFDNPIDYETAEAINALKAQPERGEIVLEGGRDDILARALKKPEHGGRVRGIGSGITNTEYFGFSKPIPPSQMRAEITLLRSEMALMKQLVVGASQMGTFGGQCGGQFRGFGCNGNGLFGAMNGQYDNLSGHNIHLFGAMSVPKVGMFTQLLTKGDDGFSQLCKGLLSHSNPEPEGGHDTYVPWPDKVVTEKQLEKQSELHTQQLNRQCSQEQLKQNPRSQLQDQEQERGPEPYYVPWPDNIPVAEQRPELDSLQPNPYPSSVASHEMDYDTQPISEHILPKGMHDCCLAIEDGKEIHTVAIGQVYIPGENEVTLNHFTTLSLDYRRASVTTEIVPTAPLPCPNEEFSVVCQAKDTYVSWPSHLIFPKKKLDPSRCSYSSLFCSTCRKLVS